MRHWWILATLATFLAASPHVEAQSALDKLKQAEKDSKKAKTPEEQAKADKAKADKAKADKEKADKEKADKAKADKEKADKEKADKEKADKEKADKEKADKEKADKEKADKEKAEKAKADKDKSKDDKAKDDDKAEEEDEKDAPPELVKLRTTRDERRKASIEKLKVRWGDLASNGNGKDELERHAKFVANLERIRALAIEKKKTKLIEKIDTLLTKEEVRHSTQMNKLREGAVPAAGGVK
ncbi:MAG TPA: hypothetical protein VM686_01675 [Polyangiaceae bacterium]|nr:hypothetical protein [Polyangiaceae bacterium]